MNDMLYGLLMFAICILGHPSHGIEQHQRPASESALKKGNTQEQTHDSRKATANKTAQTFAPVALKQSQKHNPEKATPMIQRQTVSIAPTFSPLSSV
jgi:hypothetical protein